MSSKDRGVAILFVSHFLDQVYEICDRITVLRDGHQIGEYLTGELLRIDLVQKMLGKNAGDLTIRPRGFPEAPVATPVIEARALTRGLRVRDVDLTIGEGEVLGFAGPARLGTHRARASTRRRRPSGCRLDPSAG